MKKIVLAIFLMVLLVGLFSNFSYAQCPAAPNDNGVCDTFYLSIFDSVNNNLGGKPDGFPGGSRKVYFPMYITHDVPDPLVDSIAAVIIPLGITHTNAAAYCSSSTYWNRIVWSSSNLPRNIFRNMPNPGWDSTNWMMDLYNTGEGQEWDNLILDPATNNDLDSAHWFLTAIYGPADPLFGDTQKKLFATMTLRVSDTMTIVIDSTFWVPSGRFTFFRSDAPSYTPRGTYPCTAWVTTDSSYMRCGQDYVNDFHQLPNVPTVFSLSQNYPNPFNASTTIEFAITESGKDVNLKIYNILGREVETLVNKKMDRGTYKVTLNTANYPSGVYFYNLTQGNNTLTKKMILLK